ncbi:serine hydrolase [Pedobacter gandavensis]|uniref:serine hydrolase n=1 Tax=Pedobacter gandavensis TaxID=2679963 RepID=UPI00293072B4|nr:serine hydrolase [Pedobacter gandavensis]
MKYSTVYAMLLFIFLGGIAGFCYSQNSGRQIGKDGSDHYKLENNIRQWQKELNIPNVAVGVIEDNKLVFAKVYGNTAKGIPAPKNLLFEVASLTKVVFSTLVLKLVQEGKWDLDEPIFYYYTDPEVAIDPYSKKLTSRHVLSQQSGFDNWRWMNPTGKLAFNFEPGTKFNYSGEGMEYLRMAIEKKFQRSVDQLADSVLFKPLQMTDTQHGWDGKKSFERYSRMYDADGKEILKSDYSIQASAAAGLTTTIEDLSKFGIEVLKGAHLSEKLQEELLKTQVDINPNLQQGLGWRIINGLPNHEYALQHAGNDPGVAAIMVLLPNSKRGIVVLTNGDNGLILCNNVVRVAFPEGTEIIHKAYKSTRIDEQEPIVELPEEVLKSYVGNYKREDGVPVSVTQKGKGLVLRMSGIPVLNLLPQKEDKFFLMDLDAKVFFTRDSQGKVTAVSIMDGENIIKCIRD